MYIFEVQQKTYESKFYRHIRFYFGELNRRQNEPMSGNIVSIRTLLTGFTNYRALYTLKIIMKDWIKWNVAK